MSFHSSGHPNIFSYIHAAKPEGSTENCLSPADIYVKYNCQEYINHSEVLLHIFKDWKFPIRGWSKAVSNAYS